MSDQSSLPLDRHPTEIGGGVRPRIHLLATGGTIAGADATSAGLKYRAGALPLADLLQRVPSLGDLAELGGEQFCNIGSQDMDEVIWMNLARRVRVLLADVTIAGVPAGAISANHEIASRSAGSTSPNSRSFACSYASNVS